MYAIIYLLLDVLFYERWCLLCFFPPDADRTTSRCSTNNLVRKIQQPREENFMLYYENVISWLLLIFVLCSEIMVAVVLKRWLPLC